MAKDFLKDISPVVKVSQYQAKVKKSIAERTVEGFDYAVAQYKAGNKDVKRPYISSNGDTVAFSVKAGTQYLKLDGENTKFSAPKAKFDALVMKIKSSIMDGDFDKELNAIDLAQKERGLVLSQTRSKKK